MMMMKNDDPKSKKTRTWKGRSKLGCNTCKTRRIKCDESRPFCRNCTKAGFVCGGPKQAEYDKNAAQAVPIRTPPWLTKDPILIQSVTDYESETFNLLMNKVLNPLVSGAGSITKQFWVAALRPAANQQKTIFDGALAALSIYTIPASKLKTGSTVQISQEIQRKYTLAMEWYTRSVNASRTSTSTGDLHLLILGAVLYLYCEIRLAHTENMTRLLKTAYALVYHARHYLAERGDATLVAILYELLYLPVFSIIDSAIIPEKHRRAVVAVSMMLNARLDNERSYHLEIECLNMYWDLNTIIRGDKNADDCNLDERLRIWYQGYLDDQKQARPNLVSHKAYTLLQIQWDFYKHKFQSQPQAIGDRIDYAITWIKGWSDLVQSCTIYPTWELDFRLIPQSLLLLWFSRKKSTLDRLSKALRPFDDQKILIDVVLEYFKVLTETSYDEATYLEQELFGERIKVIQIWQTQVCIKRLVEISREAAQP